MHRGERWGTNPGTRRSRRRRHALFLGFVIAYVLGNLKIFSGRTRSTLLPVPSGSGDVRAGLLSVALDRADRSAHLCGPPRDCRDSTYSMSWAARPIGYITKRDIETTFAARTRWAGCYWLPSSFSSSALDRRRRWVQRGGVRRLPKRGGSVRRLAHHTLLHRGDECAMLHLSQGIWSVLQTLAGGTLETSRH